MYDGGIKYGYVQNVVGTMLRSSAQPEGLLVGNDEVSVTTFHQPASLGWSGGRVTKVRKAPCPGSGLRLQWQVQTRSGRWVGLE